jgi:hypothetical protein
MIEMMMYAASILRRRLEPRDGEKNYQQLCVKLDGEGRRECVARRAWAERRFNLMTV